jgi:hypothetical protein
MNITVSQPVPFHGPIYCDTAHMWMGMHEPVNTISNAAILIAAYFAYRYIKKSRVGFSGDLIVLLFLLTWVGIGSALWHGLRTPWALFLDWLPGVVFLLVLTVVWIRQAFVRAWLGWLAGAVGMILMVFLGGWGIAVFGNALAQITPNLRFAPMFATVTVFGIAMVTATGRKYGGQAAILGVEILLCGIVAAVARSIDLMVCQYIPFGTHFLWHIGLSTAACLGILLMVRIKKARAGTAAN